jgi:hypothetical protein
MDDGQMTVSVEVPAHLFSGPLRLALQALPADNDPANLPAAQGRVSSVRSRLTDEGRSFFHLENDRDVPHPTFGAYRASDVMYLIPRWEDPADLAARRVHFELLFAILTGAGASNNGLLKLIDWAIEPLHLAWWSEWQALARKFGSSWHGLTGFEVDLAHKHYEQIRALRISMLNPWLSGAFPTKSPTLFGLLHADLPPVAGYVGLRLAGGSVGNLVAATETEEEQIACLLVAHRLLRFAGIDKASGDPKYVRTPSFIEGMSQAYEERMKLPR